MKILVAHNAYQQPGGEDKVFRSESALLRQDGHEVFEYLEDNQKIASLDKLGLGINTIWSTTSYRRITEALTKYRPDVVHFHNTFPLISPSGYYAAKKHGVPVVQSLHNYRLLCPNAIFLRDGEVCEKCLGKMVPTPAITHRCYRNSRIESAGVATMVSIHRLLNTWNRMVDIYIALSEFARSKFIAGGLPPERVVVKPNCLSDDPGVGSGGGGFALYVGRFSPEKGVATLLSAWADVGRRLALKLVGDGPEFAELRSNGSQIPGVEFLGPQPRAAVLSLLKEARLLVIPSLCYENFPMVAAESFAVGTPVLASDLGSMRSIVDSGRTGMRFSPGDPVRLAEAVKWFIDHPEQTRAMREQARTEFVQNYSPSIGALLLLRVYERARAHPFTVQQADASRV